MVQIDCRNQILLSFIMYSIQLTHPFGLLVSGGTKTGKTTLCERSIKKRPKKLLSKTLTVMAEQKRERQLNQ